MSEPLVPPEARAMVGELLAPPASETISALRTQQFAHGAEDLNPIYFDEEAAKAAGYRTLVAPPTYLGYVIASNQPVARMRTDGIFAGDGRRIALNVKRVMFGGQEWDFLAPAYVGDTITVETRLRGLEEKEGSSGPFVLQTVETTYTNQDGELIARSRGLSIAR
jgi:acyl dehydratase